MTGTKEETIQTYTEIGCLLKYFPKSFIEKLPNKLLEIISSKADRKYIIDVDTDKSINEQNISNKTKMILAVLTYNYWSNEKQKDIIRKKLYDNEEIYQRKLSKKYNPDDLFKNKATKIETVENSVAMVEYKESIFTKIKNWIKRIF